MVTTISSVPGGVCATGVQDRRRGRLRRATALLSLVVGCGDINFDGGAPADEEVTEVRSALTATANQSLVITAPWVTLNGDRTGDPCSSAAGDENSKEWTFGHMMKEEAANRNVSASTFVTSFMDAWTTTADINGQTIPASMGPRLRDSWTFFAGGSTALPLHKAPFKLIAIVNRIDLRRHRASGDPLGGELRFVFGFLGTAQCPPGADTEAAMIVEYSPNKGNENDVKDYGSRWLALSTMGVGTATEREAYRSALQALTEEVILNGKLLRIRTNELRFSPTTGKTWDLTELEPSPSTGLFRRVTVKQSPTMALINGSQAMSDWIWANRGPLFANAFDFEWGRANRTVTEPPIASYSVPDTFPGTSTFFRGGFNMIGADPSAPEPRPFPSFWGGPNPTGLPAGSEGAWSDARFRFSVGTCNGCHSSETGTGILHLSPTTSGAQRSPWLSGQVSVVDPITGSTRTFDEMSRRETDLRKLVNGVAVMNPVLGNNYTVRFRTSNKCLDSAGETNTADGVLSQLWACHGKGNQRLSLVEVGAGSGVYNLKYKHSGKCIDVQNAATNSGARVEQRTCSSTRNSQKLTLSVVAGSLPDPRLLKFQHSNLCLLVQNNGTADGTAIVQGTCPTTDQTKAFDLVE